jgi:ABC-type Mn2+/Zn2+ transport system permease subunit
VGRLTEPLQFTFMQTGLAATVLVGATCAVLGVYVVLRSMAFIGDALAHTILPGLVAAYLLGLNLLGGAVIAGVATALGIGWLSRRGTLREDTAIGVTFTGMFALGILLMSTTGSFRDFSHMLFGNVLGIVPRDLVLISVLALVVLGFLISALLITPAAAASLVTNSLPRMMAISAAIAVFSGVAGLYASYFFDVASGAAIVLACTACFGAASVVRALRQGAGKGSRA